VPADAATVEELARMRECLFVDRSVSSPPHAADIVREFLGELLRAYQRAATPADPAAGDLLAPPDSLVLAEAAARYVTWAARTDRPVQIAVIGPTQTGKSTLVNALLRQQVARVSPLAGFTTHPEAFWRTGTDDRADWVADLLPGWRQVPADRLDSDDLGSWSLTRIPAGAASPATELLPRNCILWDTPDFDSLAARRYLHGVLEVVALADIHVLVLSQEKYSDRSVWHVLELAAPLGRPLFIFLNKLDPPAEPVVLASLRERWSRFRGEPSDVPVFSIPYHPALASGNATAGSDLTLPPEVRTHLARSPVRDRAAGVCCLVRRHWDTWLAPVRAQQQALEQWRHLVGKAADAFMSAYVRDYLEHPQRWDSFRRAAIELLDLLELPHVGGMVARARRWVTWPMRRLLAAGRDWWSERRGSGRPPHALGVEATVLTDTFGALLAGLERDIARRAREPGPARAVWEALGAGLDRAGGGLRESFDAALHEHHARVTAEIHATARALYEELRGQPTRLAALRTARAALDMGALLLAVKTGGLTPLDVIWAPTAFALASMLMEGMAGLQMQRADRQLRARQRAAAEELVRVYVVQALDRLSSELTGPGVFGLPAERVVAAAEALAVWERGHE